MSWPMVAVGEIAEVKGGGTPSKSRPDFYQGEIPWVTPKDMKFWQITTSIDRITEEAVTSSATNLVPENSVLLVNRSGILKHTLPVGVAQRPVAINQDIKALIFSDRCDPQYAAHIIKASERIVLGWVRATTADNFPIQNLKDMPIPLPPLEEQRRIAGILDAADALRRRRREALALLDTLPGAIFAEMFGDVGKTYTLKEAGTDFRYGTSSKSQDHGIPVLRIPNVIGGDVDLSEIKTVPLSPKEEGRFALKDGDILLVRTNGNQAYVGRSAVFNHEKVAGHEMADATWSFASYLIRARLKEKELLPDFIQGFLSSAAGRKQLLASSKTSAGQFNINTEALGAIRVPKVSVPAQAAFVDRVAEIKIHRRQVSGHLSELETLFASLQSRAFAGEL